MGSHWFTPYALAVMLALAIAAEALLVAVTATLLLALWA